MPEERFMEAVAEAAATVERHPHTIVLLGVLPSSPETEYGWIEPGEPIGAEGRVRRAFQFVEKPSLPLAQQMLRAGWLWNTLVAVAKVSHLLRLALTYMPQTVASLLPLRDVIDTPNELPAVVRAYAAAPPANLSRDLLEHARESLSVLELTGVTWSDWGTPHRVVSTLLRIGQRPAWMTERVASELAVVEPFAAPARREVAEGRRARLGA
jgi:mannose-1-phosphate guanylyltransferase